MPTASPSPRWWTFGLMNVAVISVVSLLGWYLLADPVLSPLDVYPLPFNTALFWSLMFVVWLGFNLELTGFAGLRPPVRGVAFAAATTGGGIAMTWLLSAGLGRVNPDFDPSGDLGVLAHFVAALFVLFGFSTFIMSVVNWEHWPMPDIGLKQPCVGLGSIALLMLPTLLLYAVLGIPTLSLAAEPGSAPLALDTLLGWYYAVIISIVLTGVLWGNWPWRLAGARGMVALAATVGNVALGTVLYLLLRQVCKVLLGSGNTALLGEAINQFPAQLGVCWVVWMIVWANAFGNKPTELGEPANLAIRAAVTFGLGVVTFQAYYFVLAENVLHEPVVVGNIAGNALGFMDWVALVALLYIVGFGSLGLRAPEEAPVKQEAAAPDVPAESPPVIAAVRQS